METLLKTMVTWAGLPAYAVQGSWVRANTIRMSPAICPRAGTMGSSSSYFPGKGEEIRLLVIGDSSAAGVGVESMDESLGAHLARLLNEKTERPVHYFAIGFNSAVASELRDEVAVNLETRDWTHIVVSIGINDTKNFHSIGRWKKGFGRLLFSLRARFPGARIIWPEILAVKDMPRLPSPLKDIMELRAQLFINMARDLCQERGAYFLPRMLKGGPDCYADDGFHANSHGYRIWANHMADEMIKQEGMF